MANAGRILLMPKGNYSASVTYQMLDVVYYNNATWICKKQSLGNAPADGSSYWQIALNGQVTKHTHTKSEITDFSHTHTKSEITDFPSTMTPSAHNQGAGTITAGTFAGKVQANATAMATLTDAQVRDAYFGTTDMTAGTSSLAKGVIYGVYE